MRNDSLKNEAVYDRDRLDRYVWRTARETGLSRRDVLRRFTAGLAAAAASGILPGTFCRHARADNTIITPDPNFMSRVSAGNYEMRWDAVNHKDYLVANEHFYIRNHTSSIVLDPNTWQLTISGSGVENPVTVTYDELTDMRQHSVVKFMECAGNGRSFFNTQQGTPAPGGQWHLGAVGVAKWTGVRLRDVLELAGVKETAVDVIPQGLDAVAGANGHVRRPMPIEKALDRETILALKMNDVPLPADHGGPVRVVVPGWIGIASIKWVGSIEVTESHTITPYNSTLYTLLGDSYPAGGIELTKQNVKSAFELPLPATLTAGHQTLTGRSWSGSGSIKHVEFSHDDKHWHKAELVEPNLPEAWVRWKVRWHARPGSYTLRARATDSEGNVQPDTVPFNTNGYMFWAVIKHPVTVTE